jgi:hypothetical protein
MSDYSDYGQEAAMDAFIEDPGQFQRFTRKLRRKKWVVYAKGAFGSSLKAYQYLSRYTHREDGLNC